jgi:hypothetical protein
LLVLWVLLEIVWVVWRCSTAKTALFLRPEWTFFGAKNLSRCTDEQNQATR